jgi:hypothetical protein
VHVQQNRIALVLLYVHPVGQHTRTVAVQAPVRYSYSLSHFFFSLVVFALQYYYLIICHPKINAILASIRARIASFFVSALNSSHFCM